MALGKWHWRDRWFGTCGFALLLLACCAIPAQSDQRGEKWIAVVSDSACGAEHSPGGHADCIRKCVRGGAAIGHPEWKPQELVLVRASDRSVWGVDNPSSLTGFEGQRVRVNVEVDAKGRRVHVVKVIAEMEKDGK
jgi:hypothetical protein